MNTIRQPTECLLNNFIDKDIQAALRPFNILRKIFLLSNFTIISNFITPNYSVFHVKPVIGALVLILISYYCYSRDKQFLIILGDPLLSWVFCNIHLIAISFSCSLLYILNVVHTSNFVLLIVKLQYALNAIDIDRERTMSNLRLSNWIYIISIISFYFFYILIGISIIQLDCIHHTLNAIPYFLFELQIIYTSRIMQMLSDVLILWHKKMMFYKNVHFDLTQRTPENDELFGNKMLHAFKNILQSFHLTGNVFCFAVSIYSRYIHYV